MKKHAWIPFPLVALLLLAACSDAAPVKKDQAYYRARFAKGDAEAMRELSALGVSALPTLTALLQDDSEIVVQSSAMVLGDLKAEAAPAVPALLDALQRFPTNHFLAQTLKELKGEAVPAMLVVLKGSAAPEFKKQVVKLVGGVGTAGEPAIPVLIGILESSAPDPLKLEAIGSVAAISVKCVLGDALPVLKKIKEGGGDLAKYADRAIRRIEHKIELEAKIAAERAAAGN